MMIPITIPNAQGLQLEPGDDTPTHYCPCCQRASTTVHGYLYCGDDTAVYFAGFTPGHLPKAANMLLSLGTWGEDAEPTHRRAVALRLTFTETVLDIGWPAPDTSPWYGDEVFGAFLAPEVLSDGDKRRLRELAWFAIHHDERLASFRAS